MALLSNAGTLAFLLFALFLVMNFPIAVAVGMASLLAIWFVNAAPLTVVQYIFSGSLDSFALLATPLFIMVGAMMTRTGIASRLVHLAQVVFGSMPGGLGITTIVAGCILGSISGSNVATVAALSFLIFYMIRNGYPRPFAVAVVAAGCTFGVVIPPSMGFIIYGVITDTSVAKLFASGVFPGLLMALVLSTYVFFYAKRHNLRGEVQERTWGIFWHAFKDAIWGLLCPLIILGGIYLGVFTPTEAAAVAVVYILIIGMFVYRKLTWTELPQILYEAGQTVGVVVLIIATSALFGWLLQTQGLAVELARALMETFAGNKILVMLAINVILIVAGAFIEPVAAMYMLLPIFKPVLLQLGVDLVHFGAIMNVNLSMAHLTPPVGLALYLASQIGGVPLAQTAKAALPFVACEIVVILLVTYVPQISLFLPGLM